MFRARFKAAPIREGDTVDFLHARAERIRHWSGDGFSRHGVCRHHHVANYNLTKGFIAPVSHHDWSRKRQAGTVPSCQKEDLGITGVDPDGLRADRQVIPQLVHLAVVGLDGQHLIGQPNKFLVREVREFGWIEAIESIEKV